MARANWSQAIHNQALETCHYYIHVFLLQIAIVARFCKIFGYECKIPSLDFVEAPGRTIEWLTPANPGLSRTAPAGDSVHSNTFDCIFKPCQPLEDLNTAYICIHMHTPYRCSSLSSHAKCNTGTSQCLLEVFSDPSLLHSTNATRYDF